MLGKKKGKRISGYIQDYVVFDIETTGISSNYDEVIEISGVKVKNGSVTEEFTSLVNPQCSIPRAASRVNGITDKMVKDSPLFSEVLEKFLDFAGENVLVGHNIHTFDMKFIYRDSLKYYNSIPGNDYIDTLFMARSCLPRLSHHRLTDLCEFYGISSQGAHRALNDCRMNQQVYERLAAGLQKLKPEAEPEQEAKPEQEAEPEQKAEPKQKAEPEQRTMQEQSSLRFCPKCGGLLKLRNGIYGNFWGCSRYPNCRYTKKA